jgi:hypothetical protein
MPDKVYLEVDDETDVDELTDRLIAALFGGADDVPPRPLLTR